MGNSQGNLGGVNYVPTRIRLRLENEPKTKSV